ncbi:hypothetical protein PISMIDRAFT_508995 [Pisolithus microcarpus 441]|uniref:Uncharacterized protein n=1 Tax=Pisolithus microcarpus 441 TaxID=765257 RepID=A0A0C9ZR16_9AGAM|nr:hypothetical protein PISMIDRAFT_508995 [Pisolithus microcarpus 441]
MQLRKNKFIFHSETTEVVVGHRKRDTDTLVSVNSLERVNEGLGRLDVTSKVQGVSLGSCVHVMKWLRRLETKRKLK